MTKTPGRTMADKMNVSLLLRICTLKSRACDYCSEDRDGQQLAQYPATLMQAEHVMPEQASHLFGDGS